MEFNFTEALKDCREQIDYAAARAPTSASACRPCPECGASCKLVTGHRSDKSFFVHPLSDCIYDSLFSHVFFNSRDEAMNAEAIFK